MHSWHLVVRCLFVSPASVPQKPLEKQAALCKSHHFILYGMIAGEKLAFFWKKTVATPLEKQKKRPREYRQIGRKMPFCLFFDGFFEKIQKTAIFCLTNWHLLRIIEIIINEFLLIKKFIFGKTGLHFI